MDSHPFMSIHPLIPMIELFWNLTFKIQGQSHSSRSHNRYNILSPHIPFIPCWSTLPFLRCSYLKNWPWKSKVKVMGEVKVQSHNVSVTSYRLTSLLFHVNLASHRVLHTLDVTADNSLTGDFRLARPHWNNMARLICNAKFHNPLQMYGWVICFEINCTWKQMSHRVMFAYRCWSEI